MKKELSHILIPVLFIIGIGTNSYGLPTYLTQYNAKFGTKASCSLCHTSPPTLNATGNAFLNSGRNVAAIAPASGTTAQPAVAPPSPAPAQPNAAAPVTPKKVKTPKTKTLKANAKKSPAPAVAQVNPVVSQPNSTIASNQAPPVTTSTQGSTPATNQKGATQTAAKKSATVSKGPNGTSGSAKMNAVSAAATQATIQGRGKKNRDVSGGINNMTPTPGTVQSVATPATQSSPQDMDIWAGKWFKVSMDNKGYYTGAAGFSHDRGSVDLYLRIESWDPAKKVLQGSLYEQDAQTGQWYSGPLPLNYISGSNVNFKFSSQVSGDLSYGFTGRIRAKEIHGSMGDANFKTTGGYHLQTNAAPNSDKPMAGWLAVTGEMIPDADVPVPSDALSN